MPDESRSELPDRPAKPQEYESPLVEDLPVDETAVVAAGVSKSPPPDLTGAEWRPMNHTET